MQITMYYDNILLLNIIKNVQSLCCDLCTYKVSILQIKITYIFFLSTNYTYDNMTYIGMH